MTTKRKKRPVGRLRRWATKVALALTKTSPTAVADVEPPAKPAEVYRAVSAAEIVKRVGEVKVYEQDGDRLLEFAPRGWHREESFATARTAYWKDPANRPVFADVGTHTEQRENEIKGK